MDDKHQIIIGAEAFGQGPENNLLKPMVETVKKNLGLSYVKKAALTVDSGFHCKTSVAYCFNENLDAYVADGNFRKRDPRFIEKDRYQPKERRGKYFTASDFSYDAETGCCQCPAGYDMWLGGTRTIDGNAYRQFTGYLTNCRGCPLRGQCMRKPIKDCGRHIYSKRLGAVEPVFGNINTTKRLNRFTLRRKKKVNAQWLMFCLVHNIEKIQHYG